MEKDFYYFLKSVNGNHKEEPIYTGSLFDMPWWIAELELNYDNGYGRPVDYREKFENDKPGLVIYTKE